MNTDIDRLAIVVGDILLEKRLMLATVESCTGGWIAQTVTNIPGSSAWFERGFVTYSNEAKMELVGVQAETLTKHGAVSREVAVEMVLGGVQRSRADVAVSVTGIAGPDGGTPEKPVGTVWIAWADRHGSSEAICYGLQGDRRAVREASVEHALCGLTDFLNTHE